MRKLRPRERRYLVQGGTASKWQSQHLILALSTSKYYHFTLITVGGRGYLLRVSLRDNTGPRDPLQFLQPFPIPLGFLLSGSSQGARNPHPFRLAPPRGQGRKAIHFWVGRRGEEGSPKQGSRTGSAKRAATLRSGLMGLVRECDGHLPGWKVGEATLRGR
jgi:hypothetical protein